LAKKWRAGQLDELIKQVWTITGDIWQLWVTLSSTAEHLRSESDDTLKSYTSLHSGWKTIMSGSARKFESKVLLSLEDADIPLRRHIPTVIGKLGGGLSFTSRRIKKCDRKDSLLITVFTKNIPSLKRNNIAVRETYVVRKLKHCEQQDTGWMEGGQGNSTINNCNSGNETKWHTTLRVDRITSGGGGHSP